MRQRMEVRKMKMKLTNPQLTHFHFWVAVRRISSHIVEVILEISFITTCRHRGVNQRRPLPLNNMWICRSFGSICCHDSGFRCISGRLYDYWSFAASVPTWVPKLSCQWRFRKSCADRYQTAVVINIHFCIISPKTKTAAVQVTLVHFCNEID
jgi:hypothetical protein